MPGCICFRTIRITVTTDRNLFDHRSPAPRRCEGLIRTNAVPYMHCFALTEIVKTLLNSTPKLGAPILLLSLELAMTLYFGPLHRRLLEGATFLKTFTSCT